MNLHFFSKGCDYELLSLILDERKVKLFWVGVVYIKRESEISRTIEFFSDVAVSEIQWNHE